jgi:outer membrane protein OmpA-like peptidoglycan-associated protein
MSQAITFPQPAQLGHGGQPAVLAATASSGLPVTYAVTAGSSSCTVTADGMVVPTAIGTCTVTASQAGDQVHSAAAPVSRTVTVSASLPGAPHISSISAGDSAITVGYSAPFSDGGSTILSYKVTAVSSGAPTVSRSDCSASTMSCTLVGLTNGQSYTVTASAVTVAGVGDASQTVEVLVPAPTVDAPVSVVGTRASTTLDIRWSDAPAFDPATFQQYDVYVRPVGGTYGSPIAVVNSVDGQPTGVAAHRTGPVVHISSVTTRFAQATNLDPAVMYQVKIVTVTSQRATESTANTAAALVMPLANPGPPRDLSIEGSSAGTAVVSWRPPASQGGTPVTSYTVTSSRGACVMSAATSTRCTVTGLSSGDSLTVSVTADNTVGSSAPATATYSVPAAPGAPGISSVATEQTTATFAWTAPASTGGRAVTSYTAVVSANGAEAARCSTTRTTCTVRGLRAGTAYSFSVRAHNSVGAGAWSQPFVASTTTPPVAPAPAAAPAVAPAAVAVTQALPPAPARVRTTSAGSTRTRISASRGTAGVSIPITHAIISVSTRSGRLLARIKVKVDSASPETSVTVPFASSKVKVAVQFANDYGISAGGPVGVNIAEARTFDTTLVAGQVRVVGTETAPYAYFSRGSSALTPAGKAALRQAAAAVKARGGLVYVSGFAASTEVPSVWLVQSLARKRAEVSAKYLSALGVRQWIYFGGTVAPRSPWDESRVRRVVVSTDTVRHNA